MNKKRLNLNKDNNLFNNIIKTQEFVLIIFIVLIIIAKIVRYTILKESLADEGIGHGLLYQILYGDAQLSFASSSDSYVTADNSVWFYKVLNIFHLDTYSEFEIAISIVYNLILGWFIIKTPQKYNDIQFLYLILIILVLNIFSFTLAKEPIQMLFFIAIYNVLKKDNSSLMKKLLISCGIIFASAVLFRTYYILIAFFAVLSYILITVFICKKEIKWYKSFTVLLLFIGLCYMLFLIISSKIFPSEYQELIRLRSRVYPSNTTIAPLFNVSDMFSFCLNYVMVIIRMLFPFELITAGLKMYPYIVFQLVVTFIYLFSFSKYKSSSSSKQAALIIFSGFIFASATFEPDFGSWVRHESVTFPIILFLADLVDNEKPKTNIIGKKIFRNPSKLL